MKVIKLILLSAILLMSLAGSVFAQEKKEFNSQEMITELEKQIELSREQWEKLKPVLDEKSKEMQQSMHDSIDKGFAEFDKMSEKFDQLSKDAEAKAKEMLSSEEVQKLQEYLNKIDEEAILETKERMIEELTALLELTEEQMQEIKPILEESFTRLSTMLDTLAAEGSKSWSTFKEDFEKLSKELHKQLQEQLDEKQMDRLDKYNEEKKEKIQQDLFEV